MNIHFVQHEVFESPGAYLEWAQNRNHKISFSKVYNYEPLPETAADIDLLVIMGGPQSPDSSKKEYPYFDSQAEIDLIQKCINTGKAVVGVCLGAQLIGKALGAKFESSPEKEIGVFPIELAQAGLNDDKISHFGSPLSVGHWHNDMPGITENSRILAFSEGCPRQIIAYSALVYGFQCHMELNKEVIELLIESDEDFLIKNTMHRYVQKPDEIRSFDYTLMNNKLFKCLDKLQQEYENS